jgi:hypothetical protein
MPTPRPFNAPTGFRENPMGEINRQVQRMQTANSSSAAKPQDAKTFLEEALKRLKGLSGAKGLTGVKGKIVQKALFSPQALLRGGAVTAGLKLASDLAQSAGTPGQARLSQFGAEPFGGRKTTAPVYKTRFNNVTEEQVKADKEDTEPRTYTDYKEPSNNQESETTTQDPKRQSGGGLDTSTGLVTLKDVNTHLMEPFGLQFFEPNQNFDSNQLPTTDSNLYENDFSPEDARAMGMSDRDIELMSRGNNITSVFEKGKVITDPGMRAFLDYEGPGGTMGAMRAAERERGMVRIGGKNYYPNPLAGQDGQDEMIAMTEQQRRDVNAGRITVQDVGNDYINRVNGGVSVEDLEFMGVPTRNAEAIRRGYSIDMGDVTKSDDENKYGMPISPLTHPFSKLLN